MSPSVLGPSYVLLVFLSRMPSKGFTRQDTCGIKGEVTGARILLSHPFPDTGTGPHYPGSTSTTPCVGLARSEQGTLPLSDPASVFLVFPLDRFARPCTALSGRSGSPSPSSSRCPRGAFFVTVHGPTLNLDETRCIPQMDYFSRPRIRASLENSDMKRTSDFLPSVPSVIAASSEPYREYRRYMVPCGFFWFPTCFSGFREATTKRRGPVVSSPLPPLPDRR